MDMGEEDGWVAVSARPAQAGGKDAKTTKFAKRDLVRFCRGMASMLKAGISTVDALQFYAANLPTKSLQVVIQQAIRWLQEGMQPHEAFRKTGSFDPMFVGIVKAGNAAGNLESALASYATQLEVQSNFVARLRRLMITPVIVMVILIFLFIASQLTIAPKIQAMLTSNQVTPDMFSSATFALSGAVRAGWIPFLLMVVAITVVIIIRKDVREFLINLAMSKWGLLRSMIMGVRQFSFIGTLAMLQRSQVQMDEALGICSEVMQRTPMGIEISDARSRYMTGVEVSECIRQFTSCDSTVVHMIAIGEKTGAVPEQLTLCTGMLEDQTKNAMDDFAGVVSFISTAVPVFMIGLIFMTSYLPIVLMSARLMQKFSGN